MNSSAFRSRVHVLFIVAVLASFGLSLWSAGVTRAAGPITVTSFADSVSSSDGKCTLREAIIAANKDVASGSKSGECPAGSGADTIILLPGTYTLSRTDNGNEDSSSTGDLDIKNSVVISPTGPVTITAISSFTDRIFQVLTGDVTITGVTISGGNSGYGGAIHNGGTLTVSNSTITNNKATYWGGGIKNAGSLSLANVTISGNSSKQDGGGLYNYSGTATLTNVTIAKNVADSDNYGGGDGGGVAVRSVTGSLVKIKNTLIAGNSDNSSSTKRPDCSGTLTSQDYNLIQNTTGCTFSGTTTHNLTNVSPGLDPLDNYGGPTQTHRLQPGSPAIDAGTNTDCPSTDQRGLPRPVGLACDIGAYEVQDAPQPGPVLTVNIPNDTNDGVCSLANCSLREAILTANTHPNGTARDSIQFNLSGPAPHVIRPGSALPTITDPLIIDGTGAAVELDGANAGVCADGLTLSTSNSIVRGLVIHGFCGDGVHVLSGAGNTITANSIYANGGLGINLGSDGVTPNDILDSDTGANNQQNFPALFDAVPGSGNTRIDGRFDGAANTTFTLEFFSTSTCDPSGFGEGQQFLDVLTRTTNISGNVVFSGTLGVPVANNAFVVATATDPNGNTSEFSQCTAAGPDNDSWPTAYSLDPSLGPAQFDQYLDRQGQSRWFKFSIQPQSKVIVTLTNLPANYDLTIYKDINAVYQALTDPSSQDDLEQLGAEFAADAFSADRFSADAFSADRFSADAFSADAFSADRFSADRFSADAFSADRFSADIFSADAFSADRFSADRFSADRFSADRFSADRFSEAAFSTAQLRSLLGGSGFDGTASEGLRVNTWNSTGNFYVRVRGRNGAFSADGQFHLTVQVSTGECNNVSPALPATSLTASNNGYKTIILTDLSRMKETLPGNSPAQKALLQQRLADFTTRLAELGMKGILVDVSQDARVAAANTQANAHPECPFAKNLVAGAVKAIIDRYRNAGNPLEYVVIVGNDDVIPFFRHSDHALLGNESNYVPPVKDATASQASLKLGYILSQDDYGARTSLSLNDDAFPIPDLAVGRLVETAADATVVLDAYLSTPNGVVTPHTSLVTGYDFLADAAAAVQTELEAGTGQAADALITPNNVPPQSGWTADDLRPLLLGSRHDLVFLAGHFSANSALAADFTTRLQSTELASALADFTNAVIFSAGCHSGYNIVDEHGIPVVTVEPDWAQAFAQRGATLIAGTGYQYGDTDFLEYSERLYLEFSRQLRTGPDPDVAIGKALVEAKQAYLAETPVMRGIHEKALLEATLFGLPMLKVDMVHPPAGSGGSSGITPEPVPPATQGSLLGLTSADLLVTPSLMTHTVNLSDTTNLVTVPAQYVSGSNGVVANNAEPVLPLEVRNVTVPGTVLRGVGFRGGVYSNTPNFIPLVGAAGTELGGVHTPFSANTFYPCQPWSLNYFDALANAGGLTNLMVTPAQFLSSSPTALDGTLRLWQNMNFRLYYSNYLADNASAAAPPAITRVSSTVGPIDQNNNGVTFTVQVVGDPAAGMQQVWVTWTDKSNLLGGQWQSIDLTQDPSDSRLWHGTLPLGSMTLADIRDHVRFIAQAVNGVGLVSSATNLCAYFIPGVDGGPTVPTSLSPVTVVSPVSGSGPYGTQATFSAVLTSNGAPLSGQPVNFSLGPVSRLAITDGNGRATATLLLLGTPDVYEVQAVFGGTADLIPSFSTGSFTITKQGTTLTLPAATGHRTADVIMTATLKDNSGRPLSEKTVFFIVTGSQSQTVARITDFAGRAYLGDLSLFSGTYTVDAYFGGFIPISGLPQPLDDVRYMSSTASNTLTLTNVAPVAAADAYDVNEDTPLTVSAPGVLANDADADHDSLTAVLVSGPAHGALTLNANGSFVYTPAADYNGPDSFIYKANDSEADSNVATVSLTVNPVNDRPTANAVTASTDEDTPATISLSGADGETCDLSFSIVTPPSHGSLSILTDNACVVGSPNTDSASVTYTPAANYNGPDSFSYKVTDTGDGASPALNSDPATVVNLTVNPVNDAPTANDQSVTTNEETPVAITLSGSDVETPAGDLTFTVVGGPSHGTLSGIAPNLTYTPDNGYIGPDSFTFKVTDTGDPAGCTTDPCSLALDSDVATVTITVNRKNHPPDCSGEGTDEVSIWSPDKSFHLVHVIGVTDPDGDPITITITGLRQDEPTGSNAPDGIGLGTDTAQLRAERNGSGDGRVYHLFFDAMDGRGGMCSGHVRIGVVPHDQGGTDVLDQIDQGPLYDSTTRN